MEESYRKGVANHPDPAHAKAIVRPPWKRWSGAHAGWVSRSCELRNRTIRAPTAARQPEGHTAARGNRERAAGPAESKTPRMHRIADTRIVRPIRKWLKAGVMEDGRWFETKEGTPQGSEISPTLARFSHTPSAAACGRPASSALRLVRVLDPLADLRARTGARLEPAGLAMSGAIPAK
jgi:hypothetical protein